MSDDFPNRQSIRLKNYDYARNGLYFVTICTNNHENLFGEIVNGKIALNEIGVIVENQWFELKTRFDHIELHEFIVMSNHIHGIIETVGVPLVGTRKSTNNETQNIDHDVRNIGQPQGIAPTVVTIGDIIGAFKSITTNEYIKNVKNNHWKQFLGKMWQRNYHEHIIRNEKSYQMIAEYIQNNPAQWEHDKFYRE